MSDAIQQIYDQSTTDILKRTAKQIREQGFRGWGNACDLAIDEIQRLQRDNRALRERVEGLADEYEQNGHYGVAISFRRALKGEPK